MGRLFIFLLLVVLLQRDVCPLYQRSSKSYEYTNSPTKNKHLLSGSEKLLINVSTLM